MVAIESKPERYCRACWHSLHGIPSRKCPECGRNFDPSDPRTTSPYPYSPFWDTAAWIAHSLTVIAGILAAFSLIASAIGYYPILHFHSFMLCAMPAAPFIVIGLIICAMPRLPISKPWRRCGIVFPILFLSIGWTHWPLRLSLLLHQPALNSIADRAPPNATAMSGQVGIFAFRQIRVIHNGNVGFQLTGGAGGGTYLVRCAPDADRIWYNTNWEIDLGDGWHLVYED